MKLKSNWKPKLTLLKVKENIISIKNTNKDSKVLFSWSILKRKISERNLRHMTHILRNSSLLIRRTHLSSRILDKNKSNKSLLFIAILYKYLVVNGNSKSISMEASQLKGNIYLSIWWWWVKMPKHKKTLINQPKILPFMNILLK